MIKTNLLAASVFLGTALSLLATAAHADSDVPVHGYVLANGLQVMLQEDHRTPFVATNLTYFVGPSNEAQGTYGVSQVIRTLMTMRTGHIASAPARRLQNAGAAGTDCTSKLDQTSCTAAVPSANLETVLWVESDRLGFLSHALDPTLVLHAVRRIGWQRSLLATALPYEEAGQRAWDALFPLPQSLREQPLAESLDVVGISEPVVREFVEKYYVPANARLVLSGDFDRDRAQALIAKYFASLPNPPRASKPAGSPPRLATELVVHHAETKGRLPGMQILWLTPGSGNPDSVAADLLPPLLSHGYRGLLRRELVEGRRLASSVTVAHWVGRTQSVFAVTILSDRESSLRHCLPAVDAMLADLASGTVAAQELQNAKLAADVETLQDLHDIRKKAALLQATTPPYSVQSGLERQLQSRGQTQPADVARYVQNYLPATRRIVLYAIPAR